ncbi:MAG: PQQ-binding-like beta-propeller repeat protein [Phycisphaerae bacterium]|nr:PQQ-binding-like beta-propeller repeat protein [Phycisphaerae bacterium]MDD5381906.1 PQQ-binding-like beta-propeller repeat protein [Phycisphaerae bacterium]
MMRCRLTLAAVFFVFCVVTAGMAAEGMQRLVSPELLKQAELEILWETKLPIKMGESLEKLLIPFDCSQGRLGNRVYGLSDRNFMIGMNRETGNVIFKRSVAAAGLPVTGLELYKDELFSITGDKLVEISLESGEERSAKRLGFGVTCPAVRNNSHFYIAGTDKRMHVLRSEDKVQAFEVAAESDSVITSIVADESSVIFATAAGNVISITPDKSKRLWQFDAAGGIVGPIVKDGDALFAASGDTNIYRLNARTGKFVWKYQTGAKLEKGPQVTHGVIYQYVRNEGLIALDKENKKVLWQLAEGIDLLAEANGKAYVITKAGTLAVMDNKKAKQVYTVDMPGVSAYATNVTDSKIYIADKSGRIACLQPIKY